MIASRSAASLWQRGIIPFPARGGEEHGSGMGAYCYAVERTLAGFEGFRWLCLRHESTALMHEAASNVATCLV